LNKNHNRSKSARHPSPSPPPPVSSSHKTKSTHNSPNLSSTSSRVQSRRHSARISSSKRSASTSSLSKTLSVPDAAHLKPGSRIVRYGFIREKKDNKQKHERSNSVGHKKKNITQRNKDHHRNSSDGPGAPVKTKITRPVTARNTLKKPVKSSGYGK